MEYLEDEKYWLALKAERHAKVAQLIDQHHGVLTSGQFIHAALFAPDHGFYQNTVQISSVNGRPKEQEDFCTYSGNRTFQLGFYRYFSQQYSQQFVEIGGGTGAFKNGLKDLERSYGTILGSYISVDASARLHAEQSKLDGENDVSLHQNGTQLPLADNSVVGTIFSNELFDAATPFEIVSVGIDGSRCLTYQLQNNQVTPIWTPIQEIPSLHQEFERYWERQMRNMDRDKQDALTFELSNRNSYFVMNPNEESLVREMNRVLAHGQIIIVDYGSALPMYPTFEGTVRMYGRELTYRPLKDFTPDPEELVDHFQGTDITYHVNFHNIESVASELGLEINFQQSQRKFLNNMLSHYDRGTLLYEDPREYRTTLSSSSIFRVLSLQK
jgi:SAM-dependent MidA family methyltransferase